MFEKVQLGELQARLLEGGERLEAVADLLDGGEVVDVHGARDEHLAGLAARSIAEDDVDLGRETAVFKHEARRIERGHELEDRGEVQIRDLHVEARRERGAEGLRGARGEDRRAVELHGELGRDEAALGVGERAHERKLEVEVGDRLVDGACAVEDLKGGVFDADVVDREGGKAAAFRGGLFRRSAFGRTVAVHEPAHVLIIECDDGVEPVDGHFVNDGRKLDERLGRRIHVEAVEREKRRVVVLACNREPLERELPGPRIEGDICDGHAASELLAERVGERRLDERGHREIAGGCVKRRGDDGRACRDLENAGHVLPSLTRFPFSVHYRCQFRGSDWHDGGENTANASARGSSAGFAIFRHFVSAGRRARRREAKGRGVMRRKGRRSGVPESRRA